MLINTSTLSGSAMPRSVVRHIVTVPLLSCTVYSLFSNSIATSAGTNIQTVWCFTITEFTVKNEVVNKHPEEIHSHKSSKKFCDCVTPQGVYLIPHFRSEVI